MTEKYVVNAPLKGYYTAIDATKRVNSKNIVTAGEFYVYNKTKTAINVTNKKDTPGSWINIEDNNNNAKKNNSTKTNNSVVDQSKTLTTSGYNKNTYNKASNDKRKLTGSGSKVETTCYILNLLTNTKIEFDVPGGGGVGDLSENTSASYDSISIRGRSNQIQGYDTSGPRTVSVSITLHDDYCKDGLEQTIANLKALCYPAYEGYVDPPVCYVKITKAIKGIFTVGSVGVSYKPPIRDNMYVCADVSIDLTEAGEPMSVTDVESGGGTGWSK